MEWNALQNSQKEYTNITSIKLFQDGNKAATCLNLSQDREIMFARSSNTGEAQDFVQIH